MRFTPVPDIFFSHLLPEMDDMAELKTTLEVLHIIYSKKGYPRFTTFGELYGNAAIVASMAQESGSAGEHLKDALDRAVARGTLLHISVEHNGTLEVVFFLNTPSDRQVVEKVRRGEISLPGLGQYIPAVRAAEELPDIFTAYEQNIGMLTPMVSEELRDALKVYPEPWVRDAIRESANQNKRKWSYISAILERWAAEGRTDGTYRRDSKKTDPDKYVRGKYGHMVRR